MPRLVIDFRNVPQASIQNINGSGFYIGKNVYWKLYAIENFYRILIHSILLVQIPGGDWWSIAVDRKIQERAKKFKEKYLKRPWHTVAGPSDIYYIYLTDLNEIARVNGNLLSHVILDIDGWIAKIEQLRLPRNIIAHMNFPNKTDRKRIDVLYEDFRTLFASVQQTSNIQLKVP